MALRRNRVLAVILLAVVAFTIYLRPNRHRFDGPGSQDSSSATTKSDPKKFASKSSMYPEIQRNAHLLESADAFLTHFQAVTALPGMSHREAELTCVWTESEKVNFMFGADADWMKEERGEDELAHKRQEWQEFVSKKLVPWKTSKSRYHDRGIAVVAGNKNTLWRVKVLLRALKRVNSKLPVEILYWFEEMTEAAKSDLIAIRSNTYFNDLSSPRNLFKTVHGILFNYQMKTTAVLNSRFAEVLLLDSDNIPVIDPEDLFETDTYLEFGTIFWPDLARTRPQNPIWAISNTRCRMDEYEQESGQLLVDKRRYFYHLQLAAWLNNEHGNYYNEFLLGDKDMFRFAWHMLKTQYGTPKKWLTSVGVINDDKDGGFFCGHSFAQHHPNGSVAFLHGGLLKTMDLGVIRWNREKKGGVFRHYKRSKFDEKHDMIEPIKIVWDAGSYMPEGQKPKSVGSCTNMENVQTRDLKEILPGFEKIFEDLGGYWMLDELSPEAASIW